MELSEAGLSAAEAVLLNHRGWHDMTEAPPIVREMIEAYLEAATVPLRPKGRSGHLVGHTQKFSLDGHDGYLTINCYDDGSPGEIFIHGFGKDGSTIFGLTQVIAILMSVSLQAGVDLKSLIEHLKGMRFEPNGKTNVEEVPEASSLPDFLAQYLEVKHGS